MLHEHTSSNYRQKLFIYSQKPEGGVSSSKLAKTTNRMLLKSKNGIEINPLENVNCFPQFCSFLWIKRNSTGFDGVGLELCCSCSWCASKAKQQQRRKEIVGKNVDEKVMSFRFCGWKFLLFQRAHMTQVPISKLDSRQKGKFFLCVFNFMAFLIFKASRY